MSPYNDESDLEVAFVVSAPAGSPRKKDYFFPITRFIAKSR